LSSAENQNYQSKSCLLSEQFAIEFDVSLESVFLGLSRRHTGSFRRLSFGWSPKSKDESVMLTGFHTTEYEWNSMHSDQH
jgi:hypothetical protein